MRKAYIEFGNSNELPMQTVEVDCKENYLEWQKMGLSYTATGYGAKIPTTFMVSFANRWRRVYCKCYSNLGTLYCIIDKKPHIINIPY
jgi:hypothetical protein